MAEKINSNKNSKFVPIVPAKGKSVLDAEVVKPAVSAAALAPNTAAPVLPSVAVEPAVTMTSIPAVAAASLAVEPVETPIIEKGNAIMNDTINNVQDTAKTFTAEATDRAGAMFGDVSARAKTVMEKGSKGMEEMVEFSKGNMEAVVASGRVAVKGVQDIAKYSVEYGRKSIEDANMTAKKFAAVKSPTEFFALQSEVAKTNLDALVGEASKFAEGYMKLLGEIVQPMQNRYAVAVEKVKTAVAA